ncbi:MAG: DUF2934 domain-containing protein [Alphaproteobacteria bacterium]|nr:DUF2934 domain-containing protein [Alphaproteobacteria bacterium]
MNNEHVATAAYYIWENEGRPNGMDAEHWNKAQVATLKAKPVAKKKTTVKKTAKKKVTAKKRK